MGNVPELIDRVAVKASAEMIVDASLGDGAEGFRRHVPCHFPFLRSFRETLAELHQCEHHGGAGEFRGIAEAALVGIEEAFAAVQIITENLFRRQTAQGGRGVGFLAEVLHDLGCAVEDARLVIAVGVAELLADLRESRASEFVGRREIGAADDRQGIGGEPDIEWPAALAGGRLHKGHVGGVYVRALFAVYFDIDEISVHHIGDRFVLEGLALHHMAPMAGGVTDGEQDELVLLFRFRESLLAPRHPIDRVVRVLEEVG